MTFINPDRESLHHRRLCSFICIGLMLQGLAGCNDDRVEPAAAGQSFPLATLLQLKRLGEEFPDIENKTLVINFWATWCTPCRREMPDLQKLADALDRDRFVVIGVSIDDDSNLAREFLLQHDIRFPNFQDSSAALVAALPGINAYPVTFIVSPHGVIRSRIDGMQPWDLGSFEKILAQDDPVAAAVPQRRSTG